MRTIAVLLAAAAIAAVTLILASAGRKPPQTPARFLAGVIRLLAANRYSEAWTSLAPADQAVAPLPLYVACEAKSPVPGELVSLDALRVRHDRIGVAVTFAVRIADRAHSEEVRVLVTAHAVRTAGRWAWIFPPARRALYRHGCGARGGPPA